MSKADIQTHVKFTMEKLAGLASATMDVKECRKMFKDIAATMEIKDEKWDLLWLDNDPHCYPTKNDVIKAQARAHADVAYSTFVCAVANGLDLDPVFREVHRSNMTMRAMCKRTPPNLDYIIQGMYTNRPFSRFNV